MTGLVLSLPKTDEVDYALYDALPSAILVLNHADQILYANSAALDFIQGGKAIPFGCNIRDFLHQESELPALLNDVRVQQRQVRNPAYLWERKEQPATGVNLTITYFMPEKYADHLSIIFDTAAISDKLTTYQHQREVSRVVGLVSAMLAHEVKNPLSGIRGAAQLLQETVRKTDQSLTQLIQNEVDRITSILDRVECFSSAGLTNAETLNIHECLQYAKQIADAGFARHAKTEENYDPSLPLAFANREQLIMAIINLLKNAAEATADVEYPSIRIVTAYQAGTRFRGNAFEVLRRLPITIRIEDNGPGVAAELEKTLFEPFVSTGKGKGLGLAIAAKIVGDHGGLIEYYRDKNRTCFLIQLPDAGQR